MSRYPSKAISLVRRVKRCQTPSPETCAHVTLVSVGQGKTFSDRDLGRRHKCAPQRLQDLGKRLTGFVLTDEKLPLYRAVEVLERIATPEARQMLQALAGGAPGALATTTAQAALARLAKQ
jgi:hypothetical protein